MLIGTVELTEEVDLDEAITALLGLAHTAGLDLSAFRRGLLTYIAHSTQRASASLTQPVGRRTGRRRTQPAVMRFLESARSVLEEQLRLIPPSTGTAVEYLGALVNQETIAYTDQIYDAMVCLGDGSQSLISAVVTQWREEQEVHR